MLIVDVDSAIPPVLEVKCGKVYQTRTKTVDLYNAQVHTYK